MRPRLHFLQHETLLPYMAMNISSSLICFAVAKYGRSMMMVTSRMIAVRGRTIKMMAVRRRTINMEDGDRRKRTMKMAAAWKMKTVRR